MNAVKMNYSPLYHEVSAVVLTPEITGYIGELWEHMAKEDQETLPAEDVGKAWGIAIHMVKYIAYRSIQKQREQQKAEPSRLITL